MWLQAVGRCFPELGQGASFAEPTVSLSVSSGQTLSESQFKYHFPWGASLYPLPGHLSPLSLQCARTSALEDFCLQSLSVPFSGEQALMMTPPSI